MSGFMAERHRPWRSEWEFDGAYKEGSASANTSDVLKVRQACLGSHRETSHLHGASVGDMLRRSNRKALLTRELTTHHLPL